MPSFPPAGSVTVCEINRHLIATEGLSDDKAKDTYFKLLGKVFSPLQFPPEQLTPNESEQEGDELGVGVPERKGIGKIVQGLIPDSIKRVFSPTFVKLLPEVGYQGVSWQRHKHIIAFISGQHQVTVHDYEDSEGKDTCTLTCESQRDVKAIEWRPNGGKSLSVACKGGICIWSGSYPGNAASVRSGASSCLGTLSRGSGTRWTLVDFLRSQSDEQITALSWSPNGRLLASASYENSSFTIWDAAQGTGTPIRRGLGGTSVLKWSPDGDYFFAAKFDGSFYLWETNTWTSEPWSSTSGFVSGAAWDPDGRMILIAFSGSSTLGSVHFASKPPSLGTQSKGTNVAESKWIPHDPSVVVLSVGQVIYTFKDAHLLPVDLPEMSIVTGSKGIEKLAWDASGERLAVSFKGGNDMYKGLIAIYDVKRSPLISASLIGFIRGPGDNAKPVAFSFHDKFKQGPLLSVIWSSGFCCTYPLIFRSHSS